MKKLFVSLALAGALFVPAITHAQFAGSVVSYTTGSGVLSGYDKTDAALGAPTVFIGYQNADPFNPPYQTNHIVGVGASGSLTLQFNAPILNAAHPFGLDFIIFGHAGFNITNGEYFGGGITDGTFFTGGTSDVRVSVSADGLTFYSLNPVLAPIVDGLFPTDASGDPLVAVNPALTASDFSGLGLAGMQALYNGSAGGAGFDLAWAVDNLNQSVSLPSVNFIRVDGLSDAAYIDAIAVVPEPATGALVLCGAGLLWLQRRRK